MRVLLENTTFLLHKNVRIAGIIRVAGIIRGRALYEEIRYVIVQETTVDQERLKDSMKLQKTLRETSEDQKDF